MQISHPPSVEELRIASRFESLRSTLNTSRYGEHLEKPLAFWTLPSDRRLPMAFLGRTLKELLETPFSELTATPGVGHKKIRSLVMLLARAADTQPEDLSRCVVHVSGNGNGNGLDVEPAAGTRDGAAGGLLNPDQVSEVTWGKWQASVAALGLEREPLGRLMSSLRDLPCAGWNTPLGLYTDKSLAEIRQMKTHGRKRVRAILEVFRSVHQIASGVETTGHLSVQVCPRHVSAVQEWTHCVLADRAIPSSDEAFVSFIRPLLEQLTIDSPQQAVCLARYRLGIEGPMISAGQAARRMGLTRARVYQLLNMINDILLLRWPRGRRQVHELCDHLTGLAGAEVVDRLGQFYAAAELFYPRNRRLALIASRGTGEFRE